MTSRNVVVFDWGSVRFDLPRVAPAKDREGVIARVAVECTRPGNTFAAVAKVNRSESGMLELWQWTVARPTPMGLLATQEPLTDEVKRSEDFKRAVPDALEALFKRLMEVA